MQFTQKTARKKMTKRELIPQIRMYDLYPHTETCCDINRRIRHFLLLTFKSSASQRWILQAPKRKKPLQLHSI